MNVLLGGVLTNKEMYKEYSDNYVIETYHDFDCTNLNSYQELSELVYQKYFKDNEIDILIGHSMGGLIILDLLIKNYDIKAKKIVICESYISEPNEPFRNLVYKNKILEDKILSMMKSERPLFSSLVFDSLRQLDIRKEILNISKSVTFVYGMRDMDQEKFINELDFISNLNFTIKAIKETSHFCLVENKLNFESII